MKVFVINSGSSSLKYQLIDMDEDLKKYDVMFKGHIDGIGLDRCQYKYSFNGEKYEENVEISTHNEAIKIALKSLKKHDICEPLKDIEVIGHRIVHGADYYKTAAMIDSSAISYMKIFSNLAPLHMPANISGIMACKKYLPDTKQVAVFDTAFHQTIPEKAYTYGIPTKFREKQRIRKYGFHGTSHKYLVEKATELLGDKKNLKIITCHLGNGSSIAASLNSECQDTSMGFTPMDGLVMGTRCGNIDAGAVLHMMKENKFTVQEMEDILNKESGLKGIAEMSSDVRDIWNLSQKNNKKALVALEKLEYDIIKTVSSYIGVLGGCDALVFSGGIGENAYYIRDAVCKQLSYMGLKFDSKKNEKNELEISGSSSKIKVFVIPTDEELEIAKQSVQKMNQMNI
jgi:acetate kinase